MKRFLTLLFAFILVFSFAACENTSDEGSKTEASSQAASEASTEESSEASADAPEESVASEEASDDISEDTSVPAEESADAPAEITVEETVIYDTDGIKVTVKSMSRTALLGTVDLELLIENSTEQNITLSAELCAINGIMVSSMLAAEVAEGKKANESMSFFEEELEFYGISAIKDIEFSLYIYDTDTWEDIATTDIITVTTTADEGYVQTIDDSGEVVYDENGIKIVAQGNGKDDILETVDVYFYIENNSDSAVTISSLETSANGFMLEPMFYCDILAGRKAITAMSFFESDLIDNDIEAIEELEFTLDIIDYYTWDSIAETEPITLTFD